jgi:hypothetical protein
MAADSLGETSCTAGNALSARSPRLYLTEPQTRDKRGGRGRAVTHDSEALEESMKRFECVLERQAVVGECPRWDERLQRLWWVDILAPALHCYDPESGEDMSIKMPEHIGSFALTEDGGFVAAMRSGIWLLDCAGRPLRQLCPNPGDVKTTRFNDGRCDARGRFWVGTIDETRANNAAALYRLDGEQLTRVDGGLLNSNGLAFSPDGRWLYHAMRLPGLLASGSPGSDSVRPRRISAVQMAPQSTLKATIGPRYTMLAVSCGFRLPVKSSPSTSLPRSARPCARSVDRTYVRCTLRRRDTGDRLPSLLRYRCPAACLQ